MAVANTLCLAILLLTIVCTAADVDIKSASDTSTEFMPLYMLVLLSPGILLATRTVGKVENGNTLVVQQSLFVVCLGSQPGGRLNLTEEVALPLKDVVVPEGETPQPRLESHIEWAHNPLESRSSYGGHSRV
jgi:hypothetical protein